MTGALSHDAFLGGRLHLWQPQNGYRAGVDPVLLAATVSAKPGQSVLDLGCGVGAASLCLHARVPDLQLTGIERQSDYAELARRNAVEASADFSVIEADLARLPAAVTAQTFDHVIANPPYFSAGAGTAARDAGREEALREQTPLKQWFETATRRLGHKGYLHMIQRVERVPEMLSAIDDRLGSVEIWPLSPRVGRRAELVILRARKGGRAAFRLHPSLILHKGATHTRDAESYTDQVADVLRRGSALPFPG